MVKPKSSDDSAAAKSHTGGDGDSKAPDSTPGSGAGGLAKEAPAAQEEEEELSEEDAALKNELLMLVQRLKEPDTTLYKMSLETLCVLIKTSTSSMTSVPKPLKFLRPYYDDLKQLYESWPGTAPKPLLADVISTLAMSYSETTKNRECLKYRLLGTTDRTDSWGHEYLRHLSAEIGSEFGHLCETRQSVDHITKLALEIVPFFLSHNAEADAVDLLLELEIIGKIVPFVDENTFARVCLYMVSCANYLPPPDDIACLRAAHEIYRKVNHIPEALIIAMRLADKTLQEQDFNLAENDTKKMQLAYLLARQNIHFDKTVVLPFKEIFYNLKLSHHYAALGRELGISDPKSPEDIYKSHLDVRNSFPVDSARMNLATSFVNAFANVGFCKDSLLLVDDSKWIYKTKDHMMCSATASIGMLMLWDVDAGCSRIDSYLDSTDENVLAGAALGLGILHANVKNECDPAIAILQDHVNDASKPLCQMTSITGLGIAYAGTANESVYEILAAHLTDLGNNSCHAALALGLTFVGTGHAEIAMTILQLLLEIPSQVEDAPATTDVVMEAADAPASATSENGPSSAPASQPGSAQPQNSDPAARPLLQPTSASPTTPGTTQNATEIPTPNSPVNSGQNIFSKHPKARFLALGLALLYLGKQEMCEATLETLNAIAHEADRGKQNFIKMFQIMVEMCAYAGTGNVLKIQSMMQHCSEHLHENNDWQAMAVIGVAVIAGGDDIGSAMALRVFNQMFSYCENVVRRAVPLAIGLLCVSNPSISVMDTLSKYSHDNDVGVAIRAIFAMGLIGAGTNNARLAQMLRHLASYYSRLPECLFTVRIAQGLIHLGKGTVTMNPFHTNRTLMSPSAVGGLLSVLVAMTHAEDVVSGKSHWLLYHITNAIYPRFLITLDENRNPLPVSVRVGQAVDVVGQAGRPKTITGFQTHNTPVLLAHSDRAELATDEYIALTPVLEGFVILKKNPEFVQAKKE